MTKPTYVVINYEIIGKVKRWDNDTIKLESGVKYAVYKTTIQKIDYLQYLLLRIAQAIQNKIIRSYEEMSEIFTFKPSDNPNIAQANKITKILIDNGSEFEKNVAERLEELTIKAIDKPIFYPLKGRRKYDKKRTDNVHINQQQNKEEIN